MKQNKIKKQAKNKKQNKNNNNLPIVKGSQLNNLGMGKPEECPKPQTTLDIASMLNNQSMVIEYNMNIINTDNIKIITD